MSSASSKLYQNIFNLSHDGIALMDLETHFLEVNPAYSLITGYSIEELKQTSCVAMSVPEDIPKAKAALKEVLEKGFCKQLIKSCFNKNGQRITVDMSLVFVPEQQCILVNAKDITQQQALASEVLWQETHDSLTHLKNRASLQVAFNQAIKKHQTDEICAVCSLDIDHFKKLNLAYGDAVGNQLLKQVANRLIHLTQEHDLIARLGGDEFVIILNPLPSQFILDMALERILEGFKKPFLIEGLPDITLTTSIGVAKYTQTHSDLDTLLRSSEQALYQAKKKGRNRIQFFDIEIDQKTEEKHKIKQEVINGLNHNQFELYYQPKVNMRTSKIIGFEALIRWNHPEKGFMPPLSFLPSIEGTPVMIALGDWVIEQALKQQSQWISQDHHWHISINIAANHLESPFFVENLSKKLAQFPEVNPQLLELEILETSLLEDTQKTQQLITQIQALGLSMSLDDFGTGYSSLSYLKNFPVETLKIDQSFVRDMLEDKNDLRLIEATINLGDLFHKQIIAEGVETVEHGVFLLRLGCNLAQGYGIAKPMPANQVIDWVNQFKPAPLWALWADTEWEENDFPLLVAQMDHLNWISKLFKALTLPEQSTLNNKEFLDERHCRFGQWYYGHGLKNYGDLADFKKIDPIHKQVHHLGKQMIDAALEHDSEMINQLRPQLLATKDQILAALHQLQETIFKHAT